RIQVPYADRLRTGQAFEAALGGALSWEEALEIVRTSYMKHGSAIVRGAGQIPAAGAETIVQNPHMYPRALSGRAQVILAQQLGRARKPIAQIARRDRWFATS